MSTSTIIALIGIALLLTALYVFAQDGKAPISSLEAFKLLQSDSNIVVLDVRTPTEFNGETGHLSHALLIPVQELKRRVDELQKYKSNLIIVYCRTGHRSANAMEILQKHGYNARNMEGGITRWKAEQLPVVKEKQ